MNPMKNPYFAFALVILALGIIVPVVYMLVPKSNPAATTPAATTPAATTPAEVFENLYSSIIEAVFKGVITPEQANHILCTYEPSICSVASSPPSPRHPAYDYGFD